MRITGIPGGPGFVQIEEVHEPKQKRRPGENIVSTDRDKAALPNALGSLGATRAVVNDPAIKIGKSAPQVAGDGVDDRRERPDNGAVASFLRVNQRSWNHERWFSNVIPNVIPGILGVPTARVRHRPGLNDWKAPGASSPGFAVSAAAS